MVTFTHSQSIIFWMQNIYHRFTCQHFVANWRYYLRRWQDSLRGKACKKVVGCWREDDGVINSWHVTRCPIPPPPSIYHKWEKIQAPIFKLKPHVACLTCHNIKKICFAVEICPQWQEKQQMQELHCKHDHITGRLESPSAGTQVLIWELVADQSVVHCK